jgi:hypothetical protein
MGAKNIERLLAAASGEPILDPGDAGTISVTEPLKVSSIITASAETRTLAVPPTVGLLHTIYLKTDGGTLTLTVTGGYDQAANTTMTFSDVGDYALFQSIDDNGTLRWQLVHHVSGSEVVVTETTQYSDNVGLQFGTGSDYALDWNGTYMQSGPSSGNALWETAPIRDQDPAIYTEYWDDFLYSASATASDLNAYVTTDDSSTGTNAYQDAANGVYNVVTAASDNDHHAMSTLNESWLFASGKRLWFEARFKLAEANTNESAWWFGFTDTLTTGGLQANTAGPLASYDGALIWKDEATMAVDFETSNASTQATTTAMATFVTNTWTKVGFYFDGTATTSVVTPYYNVDDSAGMTAGTAQNITLSGLEEMHLVFGVKAGPTGGAETLQVDYIKVVQLR